MDNTFEQKRELIKAIAEKYGTEDIKYYNFLYHESLEYLNILVKEIIDLADEIKLMALPKDY
jgi:hypothetical protein